jgi:hypothetical protein
VAWYPNQHKWIAADNGVSPVPALRVYNGMGRTGSASPEPCALVRHVPHTTYGSQWESCMDVARIEKPCPQTKRFADNRNTQSKH